MKKKSNILGCFTALNDRKINIKIKLDSEELHVSKDCDDEMLIIVLLGIIEYGFNRLKYNEIFDEAFKSAIDYIKDKYIDYLKDK